jgi:pimeloyl-ACP methyl ester carboxylesterase
VSGNAASSVSSRRARSSRDSELARLPANSRAQSWPRSAVVGGSRGGELALLLAATYPDRFQAVVGYVPSSVVNAGFSRNPTAPVPE